jgi:hypothetical protein
MKNNVLKIISTFPQLELLDDHLHPALNPPPIPKWVFIATRVFADKISVTENAERTK